MNVWNDKVNECETECCSASTLNKSHWDRNWEANNHITTFSFSSRNWKLSVFNILLEEAEMFQWEMSNIWKKKKKIMVSQQPKAHSIIRHVDLLHSLIEMFSLYARNGCTCNMWKKKKTSEIFSLFNFILETNNTFVKWMKQQAERFLEKQNNCFQITKIYYCNKILSQVTLTLRLFITTLIFMTKYRENYIGLDLLAGLLWPGLFKPICIVPHPLFSTQGNQFTCKLTRKEAVKVLF